MTGQDLLHDAVSSLFGVLQILMVASVTAAFKTYMDCRDNKKDINAAWQAIRDLKSQVGGSGEPNCSSSGPRSSRRGQKPRGPGFSAGGAEEAGGGDDESDFEGDPYGSGDNDSERGLA